MDWMLAGWCLLYGGLGLMAVAVVLEIIGLGRLARSCFREVRTKTAEAYRGVEKLLPRDPE